MDNSHSSGVWDCDCDCKNELNLHKLCADKLKVKEAKIKDLSVENLQFGKQLCVEDLGAQSVCAKNLNAETAGISTLVANDLCVPGTLKAANLLACGKYRATVTYPTTTAYTLGSFLNFTSILDDPNNNISLAPTTYTVPVAGYYNITFKVNEQNLMPIAGPILGIPVGQAEIYVNGVLACEVLNSFLSFSPQNKIILSTMISLNAGDLVQLKYKVLAIDPNTGVVEVAGTVDLFANGTEVNSSLFKIHLLSVNCTELPCSLNINCIPCTPREGSGGCDMRM